MTDDAQGASPKNEPVHPEVGEDAETRAARRELKQSTISDPPATTGNSTANSSDGKTTRPDTPADNMSDTQDEDLREQISSPKKKRAHDQLDGGRDSEDNDANSVASTDSARDRASRLEPEKKRHRDEESKGDATNPSTEETADAGKSPTKKAPQTSASAFVASGFGKLATGSSPFAGLSGSQGSVFGSSGGSSQSPFGSVSAAPGSQLATAVAPKLTFGSANNASPFAGLSSGASRFGSGFGGGTFGAALSGGKGLASFASPGTKSLQSDKPARPFGAPESDAEDDGEDDEDGDNDTEANEAERAASPEKESEDKKKLRLQRVEVDDGEAGEATILSVRAKMFHHDKEAGWKERGAGMLKINAPQGCVEFDESGSPIPGSFDASGLDDDDDEDKSQTHKVVRLIMRQDQTHRVILNTAILPAMQFQEKASLKSVGILFTAFEGEQAKPVSVTMRMSAANAKSFLNEIGIIQRELQSN